MNVSGVNVGPFCESPAFGLCGLCSFSLTDVSNGSDGLVAYSEILVRFFVHSSRIGAIVLVMRC